VKLGIVTPVLTMLPRAHARWEEDASFADVIAVVQEAERLGYHHCTCSEHVGVPVDTARVRGGRYFDPLATFGALSAVTSTIRFATHVLVLGYHHPIAIAKRYGTLDAVSGGRLILGVGVGSLREEFELLGAPFRDRGERADASMRALRAALSRGEVDGFLVDPSAVQEHVPLWVGGRTFRSLRRAVELGDGWAPFGLDVAALTQMLGRVDLRDGFEVILQPEQPLDPIGDPAASVAAVRALIDAGATGLNVRVVHHSRAHYCEQLAALVDVTPPN
jgi:probable F420-dependent oxidoreductase